MGQVGINEVLEAGDGTKALGLLAEAKALCKVGKIIELMDFLCPEDTQYSYDNRSKGYNKK